jgi:hypothetical protein
VFWGVFRAKSVRADIIIFSLIVKKEILAVGSEITIVYALQK